MDGQNGAQVSPGCTHRWLIDRPVGEFSRGACKLCGAIRDFPEDPPDRAAYIRVRQR